jgi:hypothetical protein
MRGNSTIGSAGGIWAEAPRAYDPDDKRWHGLYVDNQGRVHVLQGTVASGVAQFEGPGPGTLNRVRITRVNANTVEQTWEKSLDNGASWKIEFCGSYARATSS